MKSNLLHSITRTIREHQMLRTGDRVGVGISGGADSTALLFLLNELRDELGIVLVGLHLNHSLRGSESDEDEQFVAALCRRIGIEFICERADVAAEARSHHWNLEDAGRRLRYAFFDRLAAQGTITRAAVAHTADDQAETMLARIFRGTGTRGLAGIHPVRGTVVRPLLRVRREALRNYLREKGESWRQDSSNLDARRMRSRLRHEVLPGIERNFGPAVVDSIARLADTFRGEEAFWSELLDQRLDSIALSSPNGISIPATDLIAPLSRGSGPQPFSQAASSAVSRRMILRMLDRLAPSGEFSRTHVEQVLRLATKSSSGHQIELPKKITVERQFGSLRFVLGGRSRGVETDHIVPTYEYVVDLGKGSSVDVAVPAIGERLTLKLIDCLGMQSDTSRSGGCVLDANLLRSPLVLRNWRPGDAFCPKGHRRTRKLKHLFLKRRIAAGQRAIWPVLTSAGIPVWSKGLPPATEFAAGDNTQLGLLIEERDL